MTPIHQNEIGTEHDLTSGSQVVLYNDDVHTTAYVAHALMMVCGHPLEIAMQIMMEAHEHGRSIAYFGSYNTCLQIKNKLQTLGLTVELERV